MSLVLHLLNAIIMVAVAVEGSGADNITRACTVYCQGNILHYVQISGIYNDSKTFVDMPMRVDPEEVNAAFAEIEDPYNVDMIKDFLATYFFEVGSDLNEWIPSDFQEIPKFIDNIDNDDYKLWAVSLNELWLVLGRQVNDSTKLHPQRTSFVPRNYPMIVPGGRFRESYYWDSWWIIRGLLVCDMPQTAEYVVLNLLDDVETFQFVPNGGRIYYLDRSQPPLLSEMVISIVEYYGWDSPNSSSLLSVAYPALQREYEWWMSPANDHIEQLTRPDANGQSITYTLNRYHSNSTLPRPESYLADIETAGVEVDSQDWNSSSPTQRLLYRNIRSGAETGWDFSSRWLAPTAGSDVDDPLYNLSSIDTTHILPVDLNSFMYRFEKNLARMAASVYPNNGSVAQIYTDAAIARTTAIKAVLWNESSNRWNDYNITANEQITGYGAGHDCVGGVNGCHGKEVSLSSWIPMWAGLLPTTAANAGELVLDSLQRSGLIQTAGVLTTTVSSGQQWDSPNAWPPLVLLTIEGLYSLGLDTADTLADDIATAWLNSCYLAFNRSGYMYEKYNAFEVGVGGGGGEYTPQLGFGWSNGVALVLLDLMYPPDNTMTTGDSENGKALGVTSIAYITAAAIFVTAAVIMVLYYFGCGKGRNTVRRSNDTSVDSAKLTENRENIL